MSHIKNTFWDKDLDEISTEIHGDNIRNLAAQGRLTPCKGNPRLLKVLPYRSLDSIRKEISERRERVLRYDFTVKPVWYRRIWNKLKGV